MLVEHRTYIADGQRLGAYAAALESLVQPCSVVLDLGSGTGILGLLACRAGAKHVYVIDEGPMLEVARANYRANGFADRATFINSFSLDAALPEKVDLVVADQMGPMGVEGRLIEAFVDARERFLASDGALVPRRLTLQAALTDSQKAWRHVTCWDTPAGFDFSAVRRQAINTVSVNSFDAAELLSDTEQLFDFDLMHCATSRFVAECVLTATRDGSLYGVAAWFVAHLSADARITNSRRDAHPIDRPQMFLPLPEPVALRAGDFATFRVRATPAEDLYTWDVELVGRQRGAFRQSTFFGLLRGTNALRKTDPSYFPTLTSRAAARKTVLDLCSCRRSLVDIEQEVYRLHRDVFRTLDAAATFVAEVVSKNAR